MQLTEKQLDIIGFALSKTLREERAVLQCLREKREANYRRFGVQHAGFLDAVNGAIEGTQERIARLEEVRELVDVADAHEVR